MTTLITDHTHSRQMIERAREHGGLNSAGRDIEPPICPFSGSGAYVSDADGHTYLDYQFGYGAGFLGHADSRVDRAVIDIIPRGVLFGFGTTTLELEACRRIAECVPSVEKAVLLNEGSGTVLHAMRLARAVTGRPKIAKPSGGFVGGHDSSLVGVPGSGSAGVLAATQNETILFHWNDLDSVRAMFEANPGQIAAIVTEPVLHNAPSILPDRGFLEGLRDLCDEHGALLVYDEMLTGFRHDIGGHQAISDVLPDLTCMGKALTNGYPGAALGGRADLMDRLNVNRGGDVFLGGTYNGNLVTAAAIVGTIDALNDDDPYEHVYELGAALRQGLTRAASDLGVPLRVSGYGSVWNYSFFPDGVPKQWKTFDDVRHADRPLAQQFARAMIRNGVFLMPERHGRCHLSTKHTPEDVDLTIDAARDALDRVFFGNEGGQ